MIYTALLPLIFFSSVLCHAASDQELFLQANVCYDKGEYRKAHDTYARIQKKGYAVFFNLGNCAYQLAEYPQAYAYWARAQYTAPASVQSALEHNYALLALHCNAPQVSQSVWCRMLVRIPPLCMQVLLVVAWAIFWWLLLVYRSSGKKILFSILSGVLAIGCGLCVLSHFTMIQKHAVTRCKVNVYAGPNEGYHMLGEIDALCKIGVEDIHESWYKIRSDALVGWILNRDTIDV